MAEPFLSELKSIVRRAAAPYDQADNITCKHFFSGAAAYVDGHIFMSLTTVGLALKLPQDDRHTLMKEGAKPLQYFPKAPVKRDYVLLPVEFMDDEKLKDWISRSLEFVRS